MASNKPPLKLRYTGFGSLTGKEAIELAEAAWADGRRADAKRLVDVAYALFDLAQLEIEAAAR